VGIDPREGIEDGIDEIEPIEGGRDEGIDGIEEGTDGMEVEARRASEVLM